MRILITGAGGFVGRNLSEYLSNKHEVHAAARLDLNVLDVFEVQNFFTKHKVELVIHCASCGGSRTTGYDTGNKNIVEDNLRMFFNIERCLTPSMRMIYFGSGAEYDRLHWIHKMKEEYFDKYIPADSYGYAKYLLAKYIMQSKNIIDLRIFGLFGKYEDYRFKFISNAIVKNILKMPIIINQNVVFDYLYISDFVKLIEHMIEHWPQYKVYNITPTKSIDLITAAHIINSVSDYKSEIVVLHEGLNSEYTGDNCKLLSEIKAFEFTPYETAIAELYNYYKNIVERLDVNVVKTDPFLANCLSK